MMQAGTYWIGDLCYVLESDEEWDEVLDLTLSDDEPSEITEGEFTFKDGRRFAMYNTMYGDGIYLDQHGFQYGVDSGSIGCIRLEDIRGEVSASGSIVVFENDFTTRNDDGLIRIGHIRIDTDAHEPEYEEDDYNPDY
jgi:hypothetical protein